MVRVISLCAPAIHNLLKYLTEISDLNVPSFTIEPINLPFTVAVATTSHTHLIEIGFSCAKVELSLSICNNTQMELLQLLKNSRFCY